MKNFIQRFVSLASPKTGLELYSTYTLNSNGEDAIIYLYRIKKENRGEASEETLLAWLEMLGHAYPDRADAEDSKSAKNLPSTFSIQFRLKDEVVVLDVGHPIVGDDGKKHVEERRERSLAHGEYDLIAAIDKRSVRSERGLGSRVLCAASL